MCVWWGGGRDKLACPSVYEYTHTHTHTHTLVLEGGGWKRKKEGVAIWGEYAPYVEAPVLDS